MKQFLFDELLYVFPLLLSHQQATITTHGDICLISSKIVKRLTDIGSIIICLH